MKRLKVKPFFNFELNTCKTLRNNFLSRNRRSLIGINPYLETGNLALLLSGR